MNQRTLRKILLHLGAGVSLTSWVWFGLVANYTVDKNNLQEVIDNQAEELYNKDNELTKRDSKIVELEQKLNDDEAKLAECPKWVPVQMELSFYTVSADECGNNNGITSSGNPAIVGRTIASNTLPQGTKVMIEGHVYTVEDTGGSIVNSCLDVLVASKEEAYSRGRYTTTVYILK